jgi:hypothetical protein
MEDVLVLTHGVNLSVSDLEEIVIAVIVVLAIDDHQHAARHQDFTLSKGLNIDFCKYHKGYRFSSYNLFKYISGL